MKKQTEGFLNQSFVVTVRGHENYTWQGSISWVEGKKQENFRSVLELLKLMDSAIEGSEGSDENETL